jgi:2,4-dienoyl-CoA reductase-like NADH-dependent reductase (Old Yellow Enzyme family)/thioredoxin reductase
MAKYPVYPSLFSPKKVGKIEIKNRIVMPPMGTSLCYSTGELSTNIIEWYKERARGGVGLIVIEVSEVDYENGSSALNSVRLDTSRSIPQLRRVAEGVHVYGTKIFGQLHHGGNQASSFFNDGHELISPSGVKSNAVPDQPREMTNAEIKAMVQKYVYGATMLKMAHFDGVEIHGAHGYLVHQFFSEHTNKRTDEYGGSFENRMRFATEIIQGIKQACGSDFPVSIRMDMVEGTSDGYKLETGVEIAKAMEKAGADLISCSMGTYESFHAGVDSASFKEGWRVYMATEARKNISIPVVCVGALRTPVYLESIINEGKSDFVALGRQLIADPEWANKACYGKDQSIRKCISCMACIYNVLSSGPVCCAINARAGHEAEYPRLMKDGNGRKVVVVGGGPGGIEVARVCAERGFHVTLFEKESALGGQLQLAKKAINQEAMQNFIDYGTFELSRLGVDVHLNTEVTAEQVCSNNPYAIFVATGGQGIVPDVPCDAPEKVITAEDYFAGKEDLGDKRIIIVGGGITGCETAALAASRGAKATVIEMMNEYCQDIFPDSRIEIMNDLEEYKIPVHTNCMLTAVTKDGICVKDTRSGEESVMQADKVVFALGVKPVNKIYYDICGDFEKIYLIGDAVRQGKIENAVRAAHVLALDLA